MDNETLEKILDNEKEWRRHMLKEMSGMREEQMKMRTDITRLKEKAGLWGIVGGLVSSVGIVIIYQLRQLIK